MASSSVPSSESPALSGVPWLDGGGDDGGVLYVPDPPVAERWLRSDSLLGSFHTVSASKPSR
jgi:hypothetical protein